MDRQPAIDCPIDLFPKQEAEIQQLTEAINQAPAANEKALLAEDLIAALEMLLACTEYDRKSAHCRLCRRFSELRYKTANLVIAAGSLGR
jgi:hypothetical protein